MPRRGDDGLAARLHSSEETCSLVAGRSVVVAEPGDVLVGAVAVDFDLRQLRLDPAELLVGQVDVGGAEVLLDALKLARAGDGHDEGFLCSIQASETWAGVAPFSPANACSRSAAAGS